MPLLKSRASWNDLVSAPSVQHAVGPVCMTCGRYVDEEVLVEGYPGESTHCKVLVRHHGQEELRTFDMGSSNWDARDLASMMRRTNWFDPTRLEGLGLGNELKHPGEHDDIDAPKAMVLPMRSSEPASPILSAAEYPLPQRYSLKKPEGG